MKRVLHAAACAALILLLAGNAMAEAVNISYVRAPFNLQMIILREHQLLEKHLKPLGIDVSWHEITSGSHQAQALASGDLDVGGVMNTTSVQLANAEGNPVQIIAGVARPTDVFALVAAKGGVASVKDLKGKTVAGSKGTVLHQLLVAALAKEGMSMQDIQFVQMGTEKAFAALQSRRVDAALLAANMVIKAQQEGGRILVTATGLVRPVLVMTASETFVREHPDRLKAVLAAHDEAGDWMMRHHDEALALGAKVQNVSLDDAKKLYDWSHFTQRINAEDIESMQADMAFMIENGMMRNTVDPRTFIQPQAME
ncbi:MAG TPA: aliphatic sulfonate ABC transporter substrate-binding protein [Candidatus Avidesulfovibrio excrementigallinarum]|nr:aliphatic sulfonate ABC transporter substrate-binding protein [Candidatus Avidesulfovibrio excrementigallinarum]